MAIPSTPAAHLAPLPAEVRVARTRALRGANLWYLTPAILADLRLGSLATASRERAGPWLQRLQAALPSLDMSALDTASPDPTRTHPPGAWWATLVVLVALELQRAAGAPRAEGRVVLTAPIDDRWTVAITFEEELFAIDSVKQAARVIRDILRGDDPEIADTITALGRQFRRARPDASTRALIAAARQRGIPVRRSLDTDVVQLGLGARQHRVLGAATERTSMFAASIASDQQRVRRLLSGVGVPVLLRDRARTLEEALESADDLRYPVRLLLDGAARGADVRVDDATGLRAAWASTNPRDEIIIEQVVTGRTIQALVIDGRVRAATEIASDGAVSSGVLAGLHADVRAACELAAGVVGLDVAAVEFVTSDPGVSLRASGGAVCAVHASPDLQLYRQSGTAGSGEPVDAILDMLYPSGSPATIPVVAITGTNGKTTTTRLIAHLFRQTGRTVGFTTTDGVYLQEQLLMQGDLTGPFAANVILSHREVEVAVLETARGGILKSGLGFEQCDVAVVMNVTADHLGLAGIETVEQLADVKAVLPAVVKKGGHAVLNADDPLVLAMQHRTPGTIALFSTLHPEESTVAREHLAHGGVVARPEMVGDTEHLFIIDGAHRINLGATVAVPLTFGGLARFQVQNVLAASLAAYVQGVTADEIRRGLSTFLPSAAVTPGRLNLLDTPRGRVLLDYAHNPAAIAGLLSFVRAMPATRRMALLSAPGDRRDEDLREIGRLATGLDLVIMKEHEVYRRGRVPGAIAELMADGLRATGVADDQVLTFTEEHDAVTHVMSIMQPGDIVIIIADDTKAVAAQLSSMR